MQFTTITILVSIFIAIMDVLIAKKSFAEKKKEGFYLGAACLLGALVDISYLLSTLVENHFLYSCLTSIYFINIDIVLNLLLHFVYLFIRSSDNKFSHIIFKLSKIYMIFDSLLLVSNPWTNICVEYIPRDTVMAKYSYVMKMPYYCHLAYAYLLLGIVLGILVYKAFKVAREYRMPYVINILSIIVVVFVNAIFLFIKSPLLISLLDLSILGYSLVALSFYWSCFTYSRKGMLLYFKSSIFDNIDQGLILFDYKDSLIMSNKKAVQMLPDVSLETGLSLEDFFQQCGIRAPLNGQEDNDHALQIYHHTESKDIPYRCDYRCLKNKKNQLLGQLFVFSDMTTESDWLTGYQNWDSFSLLVKNNKYIHTYPITVAACDITALSLYNASFGRAAGDQLIKNLSALLNKYFSVGSYFIRGDDALLIVLNYAGNEKETLKKLKSVQKEFEGNIQYAVGTATEEQPDVILAIKRVKETISSKKLLDKDSKHSAVLTSLMQALKETDGSTEAHVRRTQLLGSQLGERIGLTDIQQSQLGLLCMLHDIGKIGIPLEILNKPGKLTEEEWAVMRTHTEKGYQIAMSASELRGIAEMIRHHHESWDGSGYPDGISRETIPLLSRVIAVIDAYDAMVCDRCYRKALSKKTALEELKRHAGTQFDPTIVSEFLQMINSEDVNLEGYTTEEKKTEEADIVQSMGTAELDCPEGEAADVFPVDYAKYYLNEKHQIIDCDKKFEELTGYTNDYLQKHPMLQQDLIPPECQTEYLRALNDNISKKDICYLEHKLLTKDGKEINVFCIGRRYFDYVINGLRSEVVIVKSSDTHLAHMIAMQEEHKAMIRLEQWEKTYRCDSLTGLLQHDPFRNDVEQHLLDNNCKILFLMLDVDFFKQFNDTNGHQAGDNLLIMLAKALEQSLMQGDLACRMGGDEFAAALFFSEENTKEQMKKCARKIFEKLHLTLQSLKPSVSISMGLAISEPGSTFNSLYQEADEALYRAKEKGRDRLEL